MKGSIQVKGRTRPKLASVKLPENYTINKNRSGGRRRCQEKKADTSPVCGFSDEDNLAYFLRQLAPCRSESLSAKLIGGIWILDESRRTQSWSVIPRVLDGSGLLPACFCCTLAVYHVQQMQYDSTHGRPSAVALLPCGRLAGSQCPISCHQNSENQVRGLPRGFSDCRFGRTPTRITPQGRLARPSHGAWKCG